MVGGQCPLFKLSGPRCLSQQPVLTNTQWYTQHLTGSPFRFPEMPESAPSQSPLCKGQGLRNLAAATLKHLEKSQVQGYL